MPPLLGPFGRMHREHSPILLGWSSHVLPESPDREAWMRTTGYWFLDRERDWRPPEDLRAFLEAGEPPVSLCLGSMGGIESVRRGRIFTMTARALRLAGRRGVLLGGSRGDDLGLPDDAIQHSRRCAVRLALPAGRCGRAPRRRRDHGRGLEGRYPFRGHPCGSRIRHSGAGGWPPWERDRTRSHRNGSPPNASLRPSYRPQATRICADGARSLERRYRPKTGSAGPSKPSRSTSGRDAKANSRGQDLCYSRTSALQPVSISGLVLAEVLKCLQCGGPHCKPL